VQDLLKTDKAPIRARGEYPFRVIKQQFGFEETSLRGMVKNRCNVNVLAALTDLSLARRQLLSTKCSGAWCSHMRLFTGARKQKNGHMISLMGQGSIPALIRSSNPAMSDLWSRLGPYWSELA
jgi:hypothetical protein